LAIDGWIDDTLSGAVDDEYSNAGNAIVTGQVPNVGTLNQKVAWLLQRCRVSPAIRPAAQGTLYGGFQNAGDGSPMHMWSEYNGYIYDTMPGKPLRRMAATPATRLGPPSEGGPFPAGRVGSTPFQLSESQHRLITGGGGAPINWQADTDVGRQVVRYTP
jgi:hypothetical protein